MSFSFLGQLKGHGGWVTSLAVPETDGSNLVTASRDKTLVHWDMDLKNEEATGVPLKSMVGHSGFVQDVCISSDGQFALSGSWDSTLRLWEIKTGRTARTFRGHSKDVTSVAFSPDNRQIVSASRDRTIKIWNTLGECKFTLGGDADGHSDWVSCVRFSPNTESPVIVSCSWDKTVKVWGLNNLKLQTTLSGHKGYLNTVAVSPDGSLCASGGKDGVTMLWDLNKGEHLYELETSDGAMIHSLTFSPNRYWLCAATETAIVVWDLESKRTVAELVPELPDLGKKALKPECTSLAWSADGATLYSGYTDNYVRVWGVN